MSERRIMLIELGETDDEQRTFVIRILPRWFQRLSYEDRARAHFMLTQLANQIMFTEAIYTEAYDPLEPPPGFNAPALKSAIERIESEGVEPAFVAQRAIDLEMLIRAVRARMTGETNES